MTENNETESIIKLGKKSWAFVGITIALTIIYYALSSISALVVPLIVSVVLGALFAPLVDKLSAKMPRELAAGTVMIGLVLVSLSAVWMVVKGLVDQYGAIKEELLAGLRTLSDWLSSNGISLVADDLDLSSLETFLTSGLSGAAGYASSIFSSFGAFIAGVFIGTFILYYVLSGWDSLVNWISSNIGISKKLGSEIVTDAIWSVRRYFYALTVTSLVTAIMIAVAAAVIGVPLAIPIAIVTFLTSYIPYIGAFVSGAFAVLIALSSGGLGAAVIILGVILAAQAIVQPLLQNKLIAAELNINPAVSFGSTIVGATLAGVLGATLSAPVLATLINARKRIIKHKTIS